jgi:hypothetical protein
LLLFLTSNVQSLVSAITRKERRATKKDGHTALGGVGEWIVGSLKYLLLAGTFPRAPRVVIDTPAALNALTHMPRSTR